MDKTPILDVRKLSVSFSQYTTALIKHRLQVISDLRVKLYSNEIVAVVGASGSGKSLLAHAILGLLPYNASLGGEILYQGSPLTPKRIEQLRGKEIVLVPQSVSYLDPLMKVGTQIRNGKTDQETQRKATATLQRYGLGAETEVLYPFELSGGMARRVLIATAVMASPKLVIADEPTPGLHISAAKGVLEHFREIANEGAAVLLITHDLELAVEVADRVVVFYAGTILEEASASDFRDVSRLRHPYTKALWHAMPQNGFKAIEGMQPYASDKPRGCPFFNNCGFAQKNCDAEVPYRKMNGGYVRCIRGESCAT
ncbi:ABC transporter ATP-binding protein [Desulfotomaculum sp. 1211_IL3151]|uniref:ABC transporter ATP-binding protein n=1 Tax=Desulfotomaculum sp. 1211_IL3151 TaxID=3084055 RepID=UPI002FD892BF